MLKITQRWSTEFTQFVDDIVNNPQQVSHILLDFLQEVLYTWPTETVAYEKLIETAYQYDIPITIVTPYPASMKPLLDFTQPKYKRINMIHISEYWFKRTYNMWTLNPGNTLMNLAKGIDMTDINCLTDNSIFKYPYITTNNIAKRHRCLVMDLLSKHNLIDCGAIAWRDIIRAFDDDRHLYPHLLDSQRGNYPYEYWTPKRMFLDYDLTDFHQETVPEQYKQSFMQLVTESDDESVFFSEKTATPILLNKPFLVAGSQYHHRELNSLGFVNYDEIFDYSFDTEPDIRTRYEKIIENVKRISQLTKIELVALHHKIKPKLIYNKTVAMTHINTVPDSLKPVLELMKNQVDYTGPLNMFL